MTIKNNVDKKFNKHDNMVNKWMKDPAFKKEYEALADEYSLLRDMLHARKKLGLSQADVAERMGTKAPAVARLESQINKSWSFNMKTLCKYAQAVGCRIEIHLKPYRTAN